MPVVSSSSDSDDEEPAVATAARSAARVPQRRVQAARQPRVPKQPSSGPPSAPSGPGGSAAPSPRTRARSPSPSAAEPAAQRAAQDGDVRGDDSGIKAIEAAAAKLSADLGAYCPLIQPEPANSLACAMLAYSVEMHKYDTRAIRRPTLFPRPVLPTAPAPPNLPLDWVLPLPPTEASSLCAICQDVCAVPTTGDGCSHAACLHCLHEWVVYRGKHSCPTCRAPISELLLLGSSARIPVRTIEPATNVVDLTFGEGDAAAAAVAAEAIEAAEAAEAAEAQAESETESESAESEAEAAEAIEAEPAAEAEAEPEAAEAAEVAEAAEAVTGGIVTLDGLDAAMVADPAPDAPGPSGRARARSGRLETMVLLDGVLSAIRDAPPTQQVDVLALDSLPEAMANAIRAKARRALGVSELPQDAIFTSNPYGDDGWMATACDIPEHKRSTIAAAVSKLAKVAADRMAQGGGGACAELKVSWRDGVARRNTYATVWTGNALDVRRQLAANHDAASVSAIRYCRHCKQLAITFCGCPSLPLPPPLPLPEEP